MCLVSILLLLSRCRLVQSLSSILLLMCAFRLAPSQGEGYENSGVVKQGHVQQMIERISSDATVNTNEPAVVVPKHQPVIKGSVG